MGFPSKILIVCTDNTDRGPMAMVLAQKLFSKLLIPNVCVKSAGLCLSLYIQPVTKLAIKTVDKYCSDLDISSYKSRPITIELINWANVIWTMTESQVIELLSRFPKAKRKVERLDPFADIEAPDNDWLPPEELYSLSWYQIETALKFRIDSLILDKDSLKLRQLPTNELINRVNKARKLMLEEGIDAMVLTTENNFFYFTGLKSHFWQSPTRPNFLIVTCSETHKRPIAVVPSIMKQCIENHTWITDVRTWSSPCLEDDGVSLLTNTLSELVVRGGVTGFLMGHETHIRCPMKDILEVIWRLKKNGIQVMDCSNIIRECRMIKSPYEISCVKQAARIASAAFCALPTRMNQLRREGVELTERSVRKQMQMLMLEYGADTMPYVMCQSGPGGYRNIVMEPSDHYLVEGDIVVIDTGAKFENYWCDFDRNFVIGKSLDHDSNTARTHEVLWQATEAGYNIAIEGNTTSDIFEAMMSVILDSGDFNKKDFTTGRMGHGLGLQLTELFSNKPGDNTLLRSGMIVTLEPGMPLLGKKSDLMLVHEEDIVISENGKPPVWLSHRAPRIIPVLLSSINPILVNIGTIANDN
jgi:Xaa-Pro aminopeptidase/protein-tyrosine-phosphatase